MQPAKEVLPGYPQAINRRKSPDLLFKHIKGSSATVYYALPVSLEHVPLLPKSAEPIYHGDYFYNIYRYRTMVGSGPRSTTEIMDWICRSPLLKGILIDMRAGAIVGKFRTNKLHTSKELFDIRFDRDKVKGDLKEWLYARVRDIYEESDCDDPSIDPLDGKREELWHKAALLFRTYKQRATHINHLPCGVDPATLSRIKPDTVNNNILQIMTLYDGPGSKRQRKSGSKE